MRRSIITLGAAILVSVPATMGLVGNTSFAQSVPVRIPSHATVADDNGGQPATSKTHSEAGDDKGGLPAKTTTEATHHHRTQHASGTEGAEAAETADDKGGLRAKSARAETTSEPSHRSAHDSSAVKDDNGTGSNHGAKVATDDSTKGGKDDGPGHT